MRALRDLERGTARRPQPQTLVALANGLELDAAERERLVRAARPDPGDRPDDRLVGRTRELTGLVDLLCDDGIRMVTVLGDAGIGKSALAFAALDRIAPGTAIGVVQLDALPDAADPVSAIADAGVGPVTGGVPAPGGRRVVLVDGSAEGRISAAALAALLARDAGLRLLVTARGPVRVRAEHRWPVGPLSGSGAVSLLARRACDVRPGYSADGEEAAVAASVVRRLGGNPMGIELTAARLRTQTLSEVDAALAVELAGATDRFRLRRVVHSAVDRLPRSDAERLTLLASLGRATPHQLRRALVANRAAIDHLDATVALLATMALVTVTGSSEIQLAVPQSVREAVLATPTHLRHNCPPPVATEERTSTWSWPPS